MQAGSGDMPDTGVNSSPDLINHVPVKETTCIWRQVFLNSTTIASVFILTPLLTPRRRMGEYAVLLLKKVIPLSERKSRRSKRGNRNTYWS